VKFFNSREIMSAITSALVCTLKFVNSFARRQHRFDIAATPTDVDSNLLSYSAPLSLLQFRPKYNRLICCWGQWLPPADLIEIRSVFLRSERNFDGTGRLSGRRNGQGKNMMPLLQHKNRKHKNAVYTRVNGKIAI